MFLPPLLDAQNVVHIHPIFKLRTCAMLNGVDLWRQQASLVSIPRQHFTPSVKCCILLLRPMESSNKFIADVMDTLNITRTRQSSTDQFIVHGPDTARDRYTSRQQKTEARKKQKQPPRAHVNVCELEGKCGRCWNRLETRTPRARYDSPQNALTTLRSYGASYAAFYLPSSDINTLTSTDAPSQGGIKRPLIFRFRALFRRF